MDLNKLARYCELKDQHKKNRRRARIDSQRHPLDVPGKRGAARQRLHGKSHLSREKKQFVDHLLFDALPDPQLWKNVSKPDQAKISALLKANIITEEMIEGTYSVIRTPYLYVNK